MAKQEHVDLLKQGAGIWNLWRKENPNEVPDLSGVDFEYDVHTYKHHFDMPIFENLDLSGANLKSIKARNSSFWDCNFDNAEILWSDLCFAHFHECSMRNVELTVSRIGSARFEKCCLDGSSLAYCSAEETSFTGSTFRRSNLSKMSLVSADFSNALLEDTRVYGISAWNLKTEGIIQKNVIITDLYENVVSVGSIEIAQFIHVLLCNPKVRDVIDTITSKVILILGRFTPERKQVLDNLRENFQVLGYVPIVFDFEGPQSRNLTETISTLAHLACFVVADLTDPKSVPHELASTIPHLPSVRVQPIIEAGEQPYGMFDHFEAYPWVLEILEYEKGDMSGLASAILNHCVE